MTKMTDECEHPDNEDCLVCIQCGICREDVDEEDLCFSCRGEILTDLLKITEGE